ncbi:MAG: metal-sensing transcriptional repressor, partial [Selenomonadaceae bacterium]|nr:metal-sensing transcriptional repressor [Selenomonadaceae bacterium]
MHEHKLEDGTVICHSHSHTQTKAVLNRMARLIGHLESTKRMIEDGRDCDEV